MGNKQLLAQIAATKACLDRMLETLHRVESAHLDTAAALHGLVISLAQQPCIDLKRLRSDFDAFAKQVSHRSGGTDVVAEMLKQLDSEG